LVCVFFFLFLVFCFYLCFFFFFQAEDGIRDDLVTGVQTYALPISFLARRSSSGRRLAPSPGRQCVRCVSGPSPGVVPTPAAETLVRIGEGSSRISQQLAEWFSQSSSIS